MSKDRSRRQIGPIHRYGGPILIALLALLFAAGADAAAQRNFKEEFGSAAKPSVENVRGIAIDQKTGDVLVPSSAAFREDNMIQRFHADGTPAPFAALGTNVIDGEEANGKPCAQEPASCDLTPQGKIEVIGNETPLIQVAIDESGGATDGDIYVAQRESAVVDVFSADGRYLNQLTSFGPGEFRVDPPRGVAVDAEGTVYVADEEDQINVFVPARNPVTDEDFASNIPYPTDAPPGYKSGGLGFNLAVGRGPTAGSLFVAFDRSACGLDAQGQCENSGFSVDRLLQYDKERGVLLSEFDVGELLPNDPNTGTRGTVTINPTNGNVVDGGGHEFEVRAGADPIEVSHLDRAITEDTSFGIRPGFAINAADEAVLADNSAPGNELKIYGRPAVVPTVTAGPAREVTGTRAILPGTVDPAGLPLAEEGCYFEYGPAGEVGGRLAGFIPTGRASCDGSVPTDSDPHPVTAVATELESGGRPYAFRLVAVNRNGKERTSPPLYFRTTDRIRTEPASDVGPASATLNGAVRTEGEPLTGCTFEYGLSTSADYQKSVPCEPGAAAIPADFELHKVRAAIAELQSEATYRFRLVTTYEEETESGQRVEKTETGEEESFDTSGAPRILESRASFADQGSVTLEASINPSGFGTRYRFELGSTSAYGRVAPSEFEPFIGSGTESVLVKARIAGLDPGTAYHYRVVAESSRGTAASADGIAETLNACGLAEGRCFEEVSRGEAGPVAIPGEAQGRTERHFQASAVPGALAYTVEFGYPDATKGADVFYRGLRSAGGWESTQLSAPLNLQNETVGGSQNSATPWLADDLSCRFLDSTSPLTPEPSMKLIRELGGGNLYRVNPDGSYTPVTTLPPKGLKQPQGGVGLYRVAWASRDCSVLVFRSALAYSGVPAVKQGTEYLYEWRDGTLRNAGLVPGPGGEEVAVGAVAGTVKGNDNVLDSQNTVSADGSRVFITAVRQVSPNEAEVEKAGVFVREDGRATRDISLSQTEVPDEGAYFQWATEDGSKAFFIANSGLAAGTTGTGKQCAPTTGEGCELYEYDLETEKLSDRSAPQVGGGADVRGFLGASADGSSVYFASTDRLVPGGGKSRERNRADGSYSIYAERGGEISFVGTLAAADVGTAGAALIENQASWLSQTSPDGRYLLFESAARVTAYDSEGLEEVYLYDADTGQTTCVSCRQDGRPSADDRYGSPGYELLPRDFVNNELRQPRYLTERDGQAKVFFNSPDPLAPGAVAGQNNIYEWSHGQVFRLAGALAGTQQKPLSRGGSIFVGASADATDAYLITPETLTWEDGDKRQSAYDARIDGGFPEPPPSPSPCRAAGEGSCVPLPPPAAEPEPPATTNGGGSAPVKPKLRHKKRNRNHHAKKKHPQKKHKKVRHKKKRSDGSEKARRANDERGSGK